MGSLVVYWLPVWPLGRPGDFLGEPLVARLGGGLSGEPLVRLGLLVCRFEAMRLSWLLYTAITVRPHAPSGVAAFMSAHSKTPYITPRMVFPLGTGQYGGAGRSTGICLACIQTRPTAI